MQYVMQYGMQHGMQHGDRRDGAAVRGEAHACEQQTRPDVPGTLPASLGSARLGPASLGSASLGLELCGSPGLEPCAAYM